MRVLILGGVGLIGSALARILADDGHEVTVLDNLTLCYRPDHLLGRFDARIRHRIEHLLHGIEIRYGSIQEKRMLARTIDEVAPHCVIHLAAIPLVEVATRNFEAAATSLSDGLIAVLETVRHASGIERFVYASSSMVYGHFASATVDEDAPTRPINIYGGLKLAGEVLTRAYLHPTGVAPVIVRPSAVYGPTDLHNRVVQKFCDAAFEGRPINLNAANDHTMDFTYVSDIAKGFALAATVPAAAGETFNITYGQGRHLSDVVAILGEHFPDIALSNEAIDDADRPRRGGLCVDRARSLLGYTPAWPLERGIPAYLDHLRAERAASAMAV